MRHDPGAVKTAALVEPVPPIPATEPPQVPLVVDPLAMSERLHERVRTFAQLVARPPLVLPDSADRFDDLALDIARFQLSQCPGFARLVQQERAPGGAPGGVLGADWRTADDIPAVPVDAFRLTRVAPHPEELDSFVFQTSGTTSKDAGRHPVRDISTYRALALTLARMTLFSQTPRGIVVALAEDPGPNPSSSLTMMMRLFMAEFDGQALSRDPRGAALDLHDPSRWLVDQGIVCIDRLARVCRLARDRSAPLTILATSFAVAAALEALDGEAPRTPPQTRLMITGGFKGRKFELDAGQLRAEAARVLRMPREHILGEYGMTELTSQLYEAPLRPPAGARAALRPAWYPETGEENLYFPPPWLQVRAVDATTGLRVPQGEVGVARFVDLGNVDSAVAILTQDEIIEESSGVRLLGRRRGAPPRGCSLPFEGMVVRGASTAGANGRSPQ